MEDILWGLGLTLAAIPLAWLGIRFRRIAQKAYADDVKRYSASTMMKVVSITESVMETWENQDDGSSRLRREKVYLPTYEYTVDGKTYQYSSRRSLSRKRDVGLTVVGYYDPTDPKRITEDRPRKPAAGGLWFFLWAAILLFFGISLLTGFAAIS